MAPISLYAAEGEVLFPPGACFKLVFAGGRGPKKNGPDSKPYCEFPKKIGEDDSSSHSLQRIFIYEERPQMECENAGSPAIKPEAINQKQQQEEVVQQEEEEKVDN